MSSFLFAVKFQCRAWQVGSQVISLSGHLGPVESSPSDSRSPELSQDTLPVAYAAFSNLASYSHSLKHLDVSKMGMSYVGIFRTQVTMT